LARRRIRVRHFEPVPRLDTLEVSNLVLPILDEMYGSQRPRYEKAAQRRGIDLAILVAAAVGQRISEEHR
jgi:hypothetical protein